MIVAPVPGEIDWARATYESVRGPIAAAWRREGGRFALDVDIPANRTAYAILKLRAQQAGSAPASE